MAEPHPISRLSLAGTDGYRICVAVTGSGLPELVERAAAALATESFIELRLDTLADPIFAATNLRALLGETLSRYPRAEVLATCRRSADGGHFTGAAEEELSMLWAAVEAGCTLVDVGVGSAEELGLERVQSFRTRLHAAGARLIVSFHDFNSSGDPETTLARLKAFAPDICKLATSARTLADNLRLLKVLEHDHEIPLVVIGMGAAGLASRVLGPRFGSLFTFASAAEGATTAPGQLSAQALRELYRIEAITVATRVFGVAGTPIGHSLSPLMFHAAFRGACVDGEGASMNRMGVDAVYLPLETGSAEDLLRLVRELPLAGASVTMPLKQAILPHLDWLDPLVAHVGACNTIVRAADGRLHGYNTDVAGVVAPLAKRMRLAGARVLVQGAGGAARSAVFGLREQGASVWVSNRTRARAEALAAEAGAHVADRAMLRTATFDVLVNAVPSGMEGTTPGEHESFGKAGRAIAEPLCAGLVFDMVYNPLETPLIRQARAEGRQVITGVEMFVHQGARQFELWTGQPAPEATMTQVVLEALRQRERQASNRTNGIDGYGRSEASEAATSV